jgi:two-component system chemotaxis response regulator CheB
MAQDQVIHPYRMVVIGGSAGALDVVLNIIATVDAAAPYVFVIILHRKSSIDSSLAFLLSDKTNWPVKEVDDKDNILPGHIYIAPGDYHLLVEKDGSFSLDVSEKINYSRPSIDAGFESAADAYGNRLIAVLLSGANADGTDGLRTIKDKGGTCIIQDPATAEVSYMPQEAISAIEADHIIDGNKIGELLNTLAKEF